MVYSSQDLKEFADKLLSDRTMQAALEKRWRAAAVDLARESSVECTSLELGKAFSQAAIASSSANTSGSGSYYDNGWVASLYYVTQSDLQANPPVDSLANFLIQLRGGSNLAKVAVTVMFGDPENAPMILIVEAIARANTSGVVIVNPIAVAPAWAYDWNPS